MIVPWSGIRSVETALEIIHSDMLELSYFSYNPSSFFPVYALAVGFVFCACILNSSSKNYPPGPKPLPFLGNILQLSSAQRLEELFSEWKNQYGDVIHFSVLGKSTVVLNTVEAAQDLLEKRGAIYSDRPRFVLFSELMGWHNASTHVRYGDRFRRHRRFIYPTFNRHAVQHLVPIQEKEKLAFLRGLTDNPELLLEHTKRFATATILKVAYGADVTSVHDPFVLIMDEAVTLTTLSGSGAATLVDYFPLLKHIPLWAPFSGFKRHALKAKSAVEQMMSIPFEIVKNDMKNGNAQPSMALSLLEACIKSRGHLTFEDEEDIKGVTGTLSSAASETVCLCLAPMITLKNTKTVSTLLGFVLAMVLYPEVQRKAQEEMDSVTGGTRLPTLDDRKSLPYLECVVKEAYRWVTPVPLGMPHRLMEDDTYHGYLIPEGSTVMANIYGMLQDCPNPRVFQPERFSQNSDLPDPKELVFGFGRRKCPGRYFADANVWLISASLIATFEMDKAKDDNDTPIEPPVEWTTGLTRRPINFKYALLPRSPKLAEDIRQVES